MPDEPAPLPALPPRFLPNHRPVIARAAGGCPDPNRCEATMPVDGEAATASCTRCRAELADGVAPETAS